MSGYFYYEGGEGKRFCYAKEPTFLCPLGRLKLDDGAEIPESFTLAAAPLGVEPAALLRMVVRGHRNNRRRRDAQGRLTDRCDTCGHRMDRLGFRCWIEVESASRDAGAQITRALGGTPTTIEKVLYLDTKREAVAWAREEAALSKAIAKESDR